MTEHTRPHRAYLLLIATAIFLSVLLLPYRVMRAEVMRASLVGEVYLTRAAFATTGMSVTSTLSEEREKSPPNLSFRDIVDRLIDLWKF